MKYLCPYCKRIIEGELQAECPHCRKTMNIPDHLRPESGRRESKRAKDRIRREADMQRKAIRIPDMPFGKPSYIVFILAVMVIVGGMLAGRAKLRFKPAPKRTPVEVASKELGVLDSALQFFHDDCGRYPSVKEGLEALIDNPGIAGWNGPYIKLLRPDPWGNRYIYALEGTNAVVLSAGPDGAVNTLDDLMPPQNPD